MRTSSTRVVAGVELASGVYCIAAGLLMWHTVGWLAAILALGGVLSSLGGFWLWRGAARGFVLSMWLQVAQVVQLVVPGIAFVVVLGPSLAVGLPSGEAFSLRAAMEPEFLLAFGHHTNPLRLEVNLLALVFLVALRRTHAASSVESPRAASKSPAV